MDPIFRYHPEILRRFPHLVGGMILAKGVRIKESPPALQKAYLEEQRATVQRIGETPLSELPALAAWRGAFRQFGVKPTQYRNAAEALLRRLTKHGEIPYINAVVDMANLVSIRYALPVAAFDIEAVQGKILVKFAEGDERFTPLGRSAVEHPLPGEVIFVDTTGLVVARRWCWRQSDESASRPGTERILFTIESQHEDGANAIRDGLRDLRPLVHEYLGGELVSDVLNAGHPSFEVD